MISRTKTQDLHGPRIHLLSWSWSIEAWIILSSWVGELRGCTFCSVILGAALMSLLVSLWIKEFSSFQEILFLIFNCKLVRWNLI